MIDNKIMSIYENQKLKILHRAQAYKELYEEISSIVKEIELKNVEIALENVNNKKGILHNDK